jgi:hypothetical protein
MELAMRAATSLSTGTPATSLIAFISFAVGRVMPHSLPLYFAHDLFEKPVPIFSDHAGARLCPEPGMAM